MNDSLMLALVLAVVGMVACLFFAKPVDKGAWTSGQNMTEPHAEADSTRDDSHSSDVDPDAKVTASTDATPQTRRNRFLRKRTRKILLSHNSI